MIHQILFIFAIFSISNSGVSLASEEILGCGLFNGQGNLQEEYRIKLTRDDANNLIRKISTERKFFYYDLLIYKKESNELVGNKIQLPVPAFISFDDWRAKCVPSIFKKCDVTEYQLAKSNYENDPKWTISAYQIKQNDENYYTLNTHFTVLQISSSDVYYADKEGSYEKYISKSDSIMRQTVFISNQNQDRAVFNQHDLNSSVNFLDNEKSYSLTMRRSLPDSKEFISELTTSLVCNKH